MTRRKIDHRELLVSVLPLHHAPEDVRRLTEAAIRSGIEARHEFAARRAIDALVDMGILQLDRRAPRKGQLIESYRNLDTGDTFRIAWSTPRPMRMIRLPVPPVDAGRTIPHAALRDMFSVDEPLFVSPGHGTSYHGSIISRAMEVLTRLTEADFVTFVPCRAPHEGELIHLDQHLMTDHAETLQSIINETQPGAIYLPRVRDVEEIARLAPSPDLRSAVIAGVGHGGRGLEGYLEAWGRENDFLSEDQLLAVSLVADRLGTVFDRAALLERVVFHDTLTGLYNRRFFNIQLEKEIARARRSGGTFALAIADLDDFKSMNTRYGYYGGDELLEQTARELRSQLRPFDIAARWGGEEFALILTPPVGHAEAMKICERIGASIRGHSFSASGLDGLPHRVQLSLSMGVSIFPHAADGATELWTAANAALHEAKTGGKDRVVVHAEPPGPS